jgi:hypothetical protein
MRRSNRRPSPALVIAMAALLFSPTGTVVGAKSLVTGRDIANGSLTGADVKNKSLTPKDLQGLGARSSGRPRCQGDKGDKGDLGPLAVEAVTETGLPFFITVTVARGDTCQLDVPGGDVVVNGTHVDRIFQVIVPGRD